MTVDGDRITIHDMQGVPFTFTKGEIEDVVNLWPSSNAAMLALGAEDFFSGRVELGGINGAWKEHISPTYVDVEVVPLKPAPTCDIIMR